MSEKQQENWLSWDVVEGHAKRLEEEVRALPLSNLSVGQWDTVLSFLVLALYTYFDTRRNQDYQYMWVVKTEKQTEKEKDKNFLIVETKQFLFQKYKTAKTHGAQSFDVPPKLLECLKLYLSRHPLNKKKAFPLLVHLDGTPLTAVNAMTRILNRIFGKKVGSTMLRHIYLSNKYDVTEMNETAEKMGHTPVVQRTTYLQAVPTESVELPTD
jgi:integrase